MIATQEQALNRLRCAECQDSQRKELMSNAWEPTLAYEYRPDGNFLIRKTCNHCGEAYNVHAMSNAYSDQNRLQLCSACLDCKKQETAEYERLSECAECQIHLVQHKPKATLPNLACWTVFAVMSGFFWYGVLVAGKALLVWFGVKF
jgi:hypothetical protein